MEIKFESKPISVMDKILHNIQNQEQTLEIRINDGMPDVGNVVAAWGQGMLRSKQWRSEGICITGGIKAWVLYRPEDGGDCCCVDAWLPFKMNWDFAQPQPDGVIVCDILPCYVDARSTSARKLHIRATVGLLAEAYIPRKEEMYIPGGMPEDVQLLKKEYKARIPAEAGEKVFQIEDILTLPASVPKPEKIIRYAMRMEVVDRKVMADKGIFRGMGVIHVLYRSVDGAYYTKDLEVPFSQFTGLDKVYDSIGEFHVSIVPSNLELDISEEGLALNATLTGQYIVYEDLEMEVAEDAYSTVRDVNPICVSNALGSVAEIQDYPFSAEQQLQLDGGTVLDAEFLLMLSETVPELSDSKIDMSGLYNVLYMDAAQQIAGKSVRWENILSISDHIATDSNVRVVQNGNTQCGVSGETVNLITNLSVMISEPGSVDGMVMIGAEIGEPVDPNPNRPSIILRKAGTESLWNIAKKAGSTVDAIRLANQLHSDPAPEQVLLIPVE